ncbi:circadian clock-controlled protein daywake [Anopheles gambiae]|uniref:circadian clock-controlled protein daywake n=1 Tax=Anopheles gambiae TaxID=7165 RepID=UPI002AC97B62|nr:circadian clock-controlled protein daywake [Anopheles gambiae]
MKLQIALLLTVAIIGTGSAAKFPNAFSRCKQEDGNCLLEAVTATFRNFHKGVPEIGLVPLDPLRIDKMDIVQGDGPINIVLNFKKVDLGGFREAQIKKINGFTSNPTKMEMNLLVPVASLVGGYRINGKVLILPIQGEGNSNMTMVNCDISLKWTGKLVEKSGQQFYQVDKFKVHFDTSRFYMDFSNLFNGDKALGDNMNVFLNDNWQDILKELKPAISAAFTKIFQAVVSNVFNKVPYNELYLASASYSQCKTGDEPCVVQAITNTFQKFQGGVPALGLASLDPLRIDEMDIVQGTGPVNIVLNFKNVDITGFKDVAVKKAKGFTETPNVMEMNLRLPVASLVGSYKIKGKVLILPIQGEGISNMTMVNCDFLMKWNGALEKRANGKEYYQMNKIKATFDTTRFYMHLTNLFNGDKALGDNMNQFLNDNWEDILKELKPAIIGAFTKIFRAIITNVFENVPYEELFLPNA